jgi:uncharacterized coiled-coil protein SlyX
VSVTITGNTSSRINLGGGSSRALIDVASSLSYNGSGYGFLNKTSPTGTVADPGAANDFSIVATERIGAREFNAFSDSRIKTNIQPLTGQISLELMRQIMAVSYQYVNTIKYGLNQTYGYIAQDVEKIIPHAVSYIDDSVADIYSPAKIIDKIIVELFQPCRDLDLMSIKCPFIISFSYNIVEEQRTVIEIINSKCFKVNEPFTEDSIFVIGTYVKDFRTIKYDTINTLTFSAVKELDAQVIEYKNDIAILKETIATQQQTIINMQEQLNQQQKTIDSILSYMAKR